MKKKFRSINGLMVHLRNSGVQISGSRQKRQLINDGYYHGYKGYRYNHKPNQRIPFSDYSQVNALIEFDRNLKAILYPQLMFIETALKNMTLEVILSEGKSEKFNDIFDKLIVNGPLPHNASNNTKKEFHNKLELRNKIYASLSGAFKNENPMILHFYTRDDYVPIWAVFEIISLGEFGYFLNALRPQTRSIISKNLGLYQACDSDTKLISRIVFLITGLRNSVAHNGVIFDTRFNKSKIDSSLIKCLEIETRINDIDFSSIVDFEILTIYLLKRLRVTKTELRRYIQQFESHLEVFYSKVPANIYMSIVHTNTRNKLMGLKNFVRR